MFQLNIVWDANRVAHEIARRCFTSEQSCIWVDEPPNFLLEYLMNDVTILMNQSGGHSLKKLKKLSQSECQV
jgi:hypothetical protein